MAWLRAVVGVAILIFALSSPSAAQGTGDVVGRVTDDSGGVMPGVTVTATNLGTNIPRTTVTTETGDYSFTLLPVGNYEIKTELTGFKTQAAKIALATGDRARVDVKLELGAVSETLTVSGEAPLLQTDSSRVSSRLTNEMVQNAPVQGRNIVNMLQLTPGASEGQANATISGNRPDDRRPSSAVSINGNPENDNLHLVDGLDNIERVKSGMGIRMSLEAIQEVVVQTNLYNAENGRTLGGVVNVITKSGGNQVRGSGFYFFRNQAFDSRSFFATDKPLNHLNNFGGSIGGPISTNRTFFFADYEMGRIRKDRPFNFTVPTSKMRNGDFSEQSGVIYDPTTTPRTPFPGNIIPASKIDPMAAKLMKAYPEPTKAGLASNYSYNGPEWQHNQTMDFRVDHRLSDKDTIFARYSYNLTNGLTPSQCPTAVVDGMTIDPTCNTEGTGGIYSGPYHSFAHNVAGNWQRVVSGNTITELKFGFNRPYTAANRPNADESCDLAMKLGFQNVNYSDDPITCGIPWLEMRPTSYAAIGDPTFIPMVTEDHNYQLAGSVTKMMGAHSLKMGGGAVYRMFAVQQSMSPRSLWAFDASVTNSGAGGAGGNTFASFLLGLPAQTSRIHYPIHPRNRNWEPAVYIQDDWRATSWLTLNLGMRYEMYTPVTEADNQMSRFVPELGRIVVATDEDPRVGVKNDFSNIGPRVGFSATAPGQIVVRGGFGMTYTPGGAGASSFLKNPPFTQNFGPLNSAATSGGAPTLFLKDPVPALVFDDATKPAGQLAQQITDYQVVRAKQFNLFVEKQFGVNVATVGYVGSRGDRLNQNININQPAAGPGNVNARRPYAAQYPNLTNINMISPTGKRDYNALQMLFQRRQSGGLNFATHYTYAEANTLSVSGWDPNFYEYGNTNTYDIRHHWVGIVGYELPWGEDLQGVSHGFLSGWRVNVVANYSSGPAFSISNSNQRTNNGGSDRPNQIADPNLPSDERTLQRWFNTAAFELQPQFTAGNVVPGSMHGPSIRRLDFNMSKSLAMGASRRIELRLEMYNVTNTANFLPPGGSFQSPDFGVISQQGNYIPRQMQFAIKYLF